MTFVDNAEAVQADGSRLWAELERRAAEREQRKRTLKCVDKFLYTDRDGVRIYRSYVVPRDRAA